MVLFHGTVKAFAEAICENGIDVCINRDTELDFGRGFYFADRETAARLAERKAKEMKMAGRTGYYLVPVVLRLCVSDGLLNCKNRLSFRKKNIQWLRFVFETRLNHRETKHDLISGPMADGAADTIMETYRKFTIFAVRWLVYAHYLMPEGKGHIQYVVKNQDMCDKYVHVLGIERAVA